MVMAQISFFILTLFGNYLEPKSSSSCSINRKHRPGCRFLFSNALGKPTGIKPGTPGQSIADFFVICLDLVIHLMCIDIQPLYIILIFVLSACPAEMVFGDKSTHKKPRVIVDIEVTMPVGVIFEDISLLSNFVGNIVIHGDRIGCTLYNPHRQQSGLSVPHIDMVWPYQSWQAPHPD